MADESLRDEAIAAIEHALEKLAAYALDEGDMITDAVLVVGYQYVDDDGDRDGRVIAFPRNGCQPPYITQGLLHGAKILVDQAVVGG